MGRKGVDVAEAVLREIDGKNYVGRLLSHDRVHVRSLADELRSFGIPARMVQLPDSEFGLPSRFVLVVMADDEMSAEEFTMWNRKAHERGLKLLTEIQQMDLSEPEVEEPEITEPTEPTEPPEPEELPSAEDDETDEDLEDDEDEDMPPLDDETPAPKSETAAQRKKRLKAEKAAAAAKK